MIMENEASNIDPETRKIINHTKPFTFLEATIKVHSNKINITHYNKNAEILKTHGSQKHLRYHHANSYTSRNQKVGVLIETLIRTSRYCTSPRGFRTAITTIINEFKLLKYPPRLIRDAFKKASANTNVDPELFRENKSFILNTLNKFA